MAFDGFFNYNEIFLYYSIYICIQFRSNVEHEWNVNFVLKFFWKNFLFFGKIFQFFFKKI